MNQNTRQRIVGTVILLLVAVILLPLLFDGDGDYPQPRLQPRIPETPDTPEVPRTSTQRPEIEADRNNISAVDTPPDPEGAPSTDTSADGDDEAPEPEEPETQETEEEPALDSEGLPRGWSVRLGVFSSPENVDNLVERLRQAGHAAYTREVDNEQDNLTAVFVGPKVEREEAEALQQELQRSFQLEGRVERYRIEDL